MLLATLRSHGRQVDSCGAWGEESQENGRGRSLGSLCEIGVDARWQATKEKENVYKEMHFKRET